MGKYKYRGYLYAESNGHTSKSWRNQCPLFLEGKCSASAYGCVGKAHCAKYKIKTKKDFQKIKTVEENRQQLSINLHTYESVDIIVEIQLKKKILESMKEKLCTQGFYNLRGFATDLVIQGTSTNFNVQKLIIRVGNQCYHCKFKNNHPIIVSNNIATLYFEIVELEPSNFNRKYKSIGTCSDVFYGQINFRKFK